jgi:NTP-dependent ternary system trypsin peptidase co-occuring protein
MDARVTIAQAVRELRAQLAEAAAEGEGTEVRFVPTSVEVELGITFDVEAEAGGGFKLFSLIDLSGKAKTGNESTHKVKLTLEPVGRDGKPYLVRDTAP